MNISQMIKNFAVATLLTTGLITGCTLQIDPERVNEMDTQTNNRSNPAMQSGYANVNGLEMYYEIHGEAHTGQPPLVLLHGALSATGSSFGKMIPALVQTRQVIAFEQQAHGHTADINRPLTIEQMGEDTAAALRQLGIEKADIFGYSMGSGIALQVALNHPELVNKLVLASTSYDVNGMHPGLIEGMEFLEPEMLVGTPWHDEYMEIAPNPDDFPQLIAKVKELNLHHIPMLSEAQVQQITAPTLLILGDSDIVQPEHIVAMFRLLGGGVNGDVAGMPVSQLAILPGTSHTMIVERGEWIVSMATAFLDSPLPTAE